MEEKIEKIGFFKKIWYSVFKLEKYGQMSAQGLMKAITYLIRLALILSIIVGLGTLYQVNNKMKKAEIFLENKVGNFTYKDGILNVEKETPIRDKSSTVGEIIIDTKVEDKEEINKYLNSIKGNTGIILLKDRVLIKGTSTKGIVNYTYTSIFEGVGINELNNNQIMEYLHDGNLWWVYLAGFMAVLAYSFINVFLSVIFNAFILSLFGYLATWFAKIRMRYVAIYNLAAYSLTLSIILHAIYIMINIFTTFTIKYFQIMYVAVAAIYLIAAIFLIKSEFIKRQIEVAKIVQKQEENKDEEEKQEEKEDKEEQKENKEPSKNDNKDNKKENNEKEGQEPEGTEA